MRDDLNPKIPLSDIIDLAAELASGEVPVCEYDRGLIDLITALSGGSDSDEDTVRLLVKKLLRA